MENAVKDWTESIECIMCIEWSNWTYYTFLIPMSMICSIPFKQEKTFEKFLSDKRYQSVKRIEFRSHTQSVGPLSVLIWTQTVCKDYQHMTKVAPSKES